jgi:hypothetical protein
VNLRPGTTPAAQARHVLRFLHDPARLRHNPLTARFFAGDADDEAALMTVRSVVRAALPPGSRMLALVERCDFQGRPHKDVAREMNLSERQFYRERSRGFRAIADALARHDVEMTNPELEIGLRIDFLHDLLQNGFAGNALAFSDSDLSAGVPRSAQARLYALRAAALVWVADAPAVAAELALASRLADGEPLAVAQCRMAEAELAYRELRVDDAKRLAGEAIALTRAPAHGQDPVAVRAHVRHLLRLAHISEESDDPRAACALLDRAEAFVTARMNREHPMLGSLMVEFAFAALCIPGKARAAEKAALEARMLAYRARSSAVAAHAEIALAFVRILAGDPAAMRHAFAGVELGRHGLAGEPLGGVCLAAARALTLCGQAGAAELLIREARTHLTPRRYLHSISLIREAEALQALGDSEQSARAAELACRRLGSVSGGHFLGSAHFAAANAYAALGRHVTASEHLRIALPLLESAGIVVESIRANELAASLFGDPRYARNARELRHSSAACVAMPAPNGRAPAPRRRIPATRTQSASGSMMSARTVRSS